MADEKEPKPKTKKADAEEAPEKKLLRVKGTVELRDDGGAEVILFERDRRHPGGEAYVAGTDEADVYPTAGVISRLRDGKLVEA